MKRQKGIQRLILRGGGDVSVCGEVGQVVANLFLPKPTRVLRIVILDVAEDPAEIGFLGAVVVSFAPTGRPDAIQEGGRLM